MKILYLGDIMGEPGIKMVEKHLYNLKKQHSVDVVIAQAENVTNGKGFGVADYSRLKALGVDGFTGGNWTMLLPETKELLNNPDVPVTRPANYPEGTDGLEHKILKVGSKDILLVSLLGAIVGKDSTKEVDNPLLKIDEILNMLSDIKTDAIIVNFHGDYSSEKVIIGHYLDGRVSLVVGDHWHIPTADARVLPKGTAHITDVGMVGSLDSSLGVKFSSVIDRWREGKITSNELEENGAMQLCGVVVDVDEDGLAKSIEQVRIV